MSKRIYSLNLAAFITMETGIEPELDIDITDGNGLVHCVFPECDKVADAIRNYKRDKELHEFLQTYADLREKIKTLREV